MKRSLALATIALLLSPSACAGGKAQHEEAKPPSSFEVPFHGPGQLATIWSWGRNRPDVNKALVVTAHGRSRRLEIEAPSRVRWGSPSELIVEQFVRPVRNASGIRILRVSPQGEVREVLSDRRGLAEAEPSPDGSSVLLVRYNENGFQRLELRSLVDDLRLLTVYPPPTDPNTGFYGHPVWSPDGSKFAVGLDVPNPRTHHLHARLAIVSRDTPGYTRVPDSPPGEEPVEGGVPPLFWGEDGIYVRTTKIGSGLLRCDPEGSGCTPVYAPGRHRLVLGGRPVGDHEALLLVKDFRVDWLEARSKEIHQVDLATGEGHVLLRLPDGVFVDDLDWTADASDPISRASR